MTDFIRSSPPALALYSRVPTPAASPIAVGVPTSPAAAPQTAPGPRLHRPTSSDRYTPSAAAAPSLRDRLTGLSVNSAALSTLGAVDSLLAEHYGAAASSGESN